MADEKESTGYDGPVGGWASVQEVAGILAKEGVVLHGSRVLMKQNKPDGFACVSCAWAKPAEPHPFEYCQNGAKATAWELTSKRAEPDFFEQHTLAELEGWSDHQLESVGRITEPMRWDAATDRYVRTPWPQAYSEIGAALRALDPKSVVFYASGRASLEASYMWQLFARMYGNNNLPDSSNMCHESTSVALPETIGVPVGTVVLDDFEATDCIFFFGQNVGTNSPRMLHQLKACRERGVPIVTFNPLKERGLVEFKSPQSPVQMLGGPSTVISTQFHQLRVGGDLAVLSGICKWLIEADDAAQATGAPRILDVDFITTHTHGFEAFAASMRAMGWDEIERGAGLSRSAIETAAREYARAERVIAVYGMGLTQHRKGVLNVQMLSNLLLLRGNIGRRGAGICPVRGHSNVQGQRTVGITEKPELAPLDKLAELYGFEPPRDKGLDTVGACEGIIDGSVRGFVSLGGNFLRAVPETGRMEDAWRKLRLTVQIATKLNRSHLLHGEAAWLLPCLGRIEVDRQRGGPQAVSVEDSTGCFHGSRGMSEPAAANLRSEHAIIAGIAKATLPRNPKVDWDAWVGDYALVRAAIERTWPERFADFERRMWEPGGFHRPVPARERVWETDNGKANFVVPGTLDANPDTTTDGVRVLQLTTLRSDDQFNTTVYGLDDRFRGISGTRLVLLANPDDMRALGFADGDRVVARTHADDGVERSVAGLEMRAYDIPSGCVAGYFPELNPLIPLWHHAEGSHVPAAKSVPVTLSRPS